LIREGEGRGVLRFSFCLGPEAILVGELSQHQAGGTRVEPRLGLSGLFAGELLEDLQGSSNPGQRLGGLAVVFDSQGFDSDVTLSGTTPNTYAGLTRVTGGFLELEKSPGVNAVPGAMQIDFANIAAGDVFVRNSNQFPTAAPITLRGELTVVGGASQTVGPVALQGGTLNGFSGNLILGRDLTAAVDPTNPNRNQSDLTGISLGASSRTITFLDPNAVVLVNGLSGPSGIGLTKAGPGLLDIVASTYTGPTNVDGGFFEAFAGFPSGVFVHTGATLAGFGAGGIVSTGGTVSPGPITVTGQSFPGTLLVNADATFDANTHFVVQLNGTAPNAFDQLAIAHNGGVVNLNNATLDATLGFSSAVGDSFVIINNDGGSSIQGILELPGGQPLVQGATFTLQTPNGRAQRFLITYQGGANGRSVELIHINTAPMAENLRLATVPDNRELTDDQHTIVQGSTVQLTGNLTDPDEGDTLTLEIDWGDGSPIETFDPGTDPFDPAPTHTYATPPDGQLSGDYVMTALWRDNHGDFNFHQFTITVHAPPVVTLPVSELQVAVGDVMVVSGSFSEPGVNFWAAAVDYGDGSGPQQLQLNDDMTFTLSNVYTQPGQYQVFVAVFDPDGGVGTATLLVNVV
jgi:autotransporter-associated beta strand protein